MKVEPGLLATWALTVAFIVLLVMVGVIIYSYLPHM